MYPVIRALEKIKTGFNVYALTYNGEDLCYAGGSMGMIGSLQMSTHSFFPLSRLGEPLFSLKYMECGLLAGSQAGNLWCMNKETGLGRIIYRCNSPVYDIQALDPYILLALGNGQLHFLSADTFLLSHTSQLSSKALRKLLVRGEEIYIGASDGAVYAYNAIGESKKIAVHAGSVFSLCIPATGHRLYSGSMDAHLQVVLTDTGERLYDIPAHLYTINDLILIGTDEKYLLSASRDKTIKLWASDTMQLLAVLDAAKGVMHRASVNKLIKSDDNRHFISGSDETSLILWLLES